MLLRPYQPDDLPVVTRFIGACWQRDTSRNYHPGDFVHWMSNGYRGENLDHHFHILEEADRIRAVVELDADSGSYAHVLDARGRDGAWIRAFHRACIAILRKRMPKEGVQTVKVNLATSDKAGKACLMQLGFKAQKADYAVMRRSLDRVPKPHLPDGFAIRCVTGKDDARLVADVHNAAFKPKWSEAEYRKVMQTAGFDPQRELVVVAPDGRFAAFVVVWFDQISGSGLFEPVGCHRDFIRRGLTRALMYAGMARMKDAGMQAAIVGYEPTNIAAFKLYRSVGFAAYFETVDCVLELENMP
ncbi:MAG: GNAT family N-acetyltransferase [Paracoccaceae bacterium]